eukprot:124053-Chlamydomonas_euryale.AAC.1
MRSARRCARTCVAQWRRPFRSSRKTRATEYSAHRLGRQGCGVDFRVARQQQNGAIPQPFYLVTSQPHVTHVASFHFPPSPPLPRPLADCSLLVQCNKLAVDIDNEMVIVHNFTRDKYRLKFPELESLVHHPVRQAVARHSAASSAPGGATAGRYAVMCRERLLIGDEWTCKKSSSCACRHLCSRRPAACCRFVLCVLHAVCPACGVSRMRCVPCAVCPMYCAVLWFCAVCPMCTRSLPTFPSIPLTCIIRWDVRGPVHATPPLPTHLNRRASHPGQL